MEIECRIFDEARKIVPISGSAIINDAFANWNYIAIAARPWFVKKGCIAGSESTGKSTLAWNLGRHFKTVFVPEMARFIIEKKVDVTFENLMEIASLHATTNIEKIKEAEKLLICDTDVNITKSYSKYLFNKKLIVPEWIEKANKFDLYLILETDCSYMQDGTRISEAERNEFSGYHKGQLPNPSINFHLLTGNWKDRFEKSVQLINKFIFNT